MPTVVELKEKCKQKGLKGYSKLKKEELIKLLDDSKSKVNIPPAIVSKQCKKPCTPDKICNTKTGICVKRDGKIGREIIKQVKTPPLKVKTPPLKVKTPPLKVKTPPLKVKTPPLKVKTPPLKVKTPPLKVKTPPLKVKTPSPKVTHRDMLVLYRTTKGRYELAKEVRSLLRTQGLENCIINNRIDNINIYKKLGEGSFGNVFLGGCIQSKPGVCEIPIAVKQGRITKKTVKDVEKHEGWQEINILNKIIRPLVEGGKCPNLPLLYKDYFCGVCDFTFKGEKKVYPCSIQLMELATYGGMDKYIEEKLEEIDIYCMLFQCFAGLHALQMNGVFQNDMKLANILVDSVKPGGYWKYTILGEDYYIPNRGKVFLINDFGVSFVTIPKYGNENDPFAKSVQIQDGKLYPLPVKDIAGLVAVDFENKKYTVSKRPFTKQVEYMPLPSTKYEPLTNELLNHPEVFPSNAFVIDTSDLIYSFVGGFERMNQPGKHPNTPLPEKIKSSLMKYALYGDQKGTGFVKHIPNIINKINVMQPYHILAGYFINSYFKNMFRVNNGDVLEEYKL